MIRAAVWDMDGTLLDSMPVWKNFGAGWLESLHCTPEANLSDTLFPMTMDEGIAYLKQHYALPMGAEAIAADMGRLAFAKYETEIPLKAGVQTFLQGLARAGVAQAVATNSERRCAEAAFARLGIRGYFAAVYGAGELPFTKGQPACFAALAEKLAVRPDELLVWEDGAYAAQAAKAAGCRVVGVYDAVSCARQAQLKQACDIYLSDYSDYAAFVRQLRQKE